MAQVSTLVGSQGHFGVSLDSGSFVLGYMDTSHAYPYLSLIVLSHAYCSMVGYCLRSLHMFVLFLLSLVSIYAVGFRPWIAKSKYLVHPRYLPTSCTSQAAVGLFGLGPFTRHPLLSTPFQSGALRCLPQSTQLPSSPGRYIVFRLSIGRYHLFFETSPCYHHS